MNKDGSSNHIYVDSYYGPSFGGTSDLHVPA